MVTFILSEFKFTLQVFLSVLFGPPCSSSSCDPTADCFTLGAGYRDSPIDCSTTKYTVDFICCKYSINIISAVLIAVVLMVAAFYVFSAVIKQAVYLREWNKLNQMSAIAVAVFSWGLVILLSSALTVTSTFAVCVYSLALVVCSSTAAGLTLACYNLVKSQR